MKKELKAHTKIFTVSLLLLTAFTFISCEYAVLEGFYRKHNVSERAASLYSLPDSDAPDPTLAKGKYFVAAFSDIHLYTSKSTLGDRDPFKEGLKDQLTALKELSDANPTKNLFPKFTLCLGDIADHGTESEYVEYKTFTDELKTDLNLVTYNVLGNHDLYNTGWEPYEKLVYPYKSFYRFNTEKFSWYVLDSASGSLGPAQLKILEEACKEDARPKIFLMHCPMYGDWTLNMGYFTLQNSYESDRLITLAQNSNVKLVMEGHTHKYNEHQIGNFVEHTVSSLRAEHEWTLLFVNEDDASTQRFRITEDVKTKEDFARILADYLE